MTDISEGEITASVIATVTATRQRGRPSAVVIHAETFQTAYPADRQRNGTTGRMWRANTVRPLPAIA